jgi:hypothetical protein
MDEVSTPRVNENFGREIGQGERERERREIYL